MPSINKEAGGYKKVFTKQDFLDGKCTKEGHPLPKNAEGKPIPQAQPSIVVQPETTTSGNASNVEVTIEDYNGDIADAGESQKDAEGQDDSGESPDREAT